MGFDFDSTGSDNITLVIDQGFTCPENTGGHEFSGTLGCPHDYQHLWGHYCLHCYAQVLYSDLDAMCERGVGQ